MSQSHPTGSANSIKMFEDNAEIKNLFDEEVLVEKPNVRTIKLTKKPELAILKSINDSNL